MGLQLEAIFSLGPDLIVRAVLLSSVSFLLQDGPVLTGGRAVGELEHDGVGAWVQEPIFIQLFGNARVCHPRRGDSNSACITTVPVLSAAGMEHVPLSGRKVLTLTSGSQASSQP